MNRKYFIPGLAGLSLGLFTADMFNASILLSIVVAMLLVLGLWISYCKLFGVSLEKDAYTFIPFFFFLAYPARHLITIPSNISRGSFLPSLLILMVALSLFVWLKASQSKLSVRIPAKKILIGLVILYIMVFSVLSILKHAAFYSTAYDLGIYDQTVWAYSKGNLITNSIAETQLLGDHVQPILFFLAPLYWIYPNPIVLLILQTMILGLGAIPLFYLVKKVLNSEWFALAFSFVYLIHPSIQYMNLFDFHPVTLSVSFILFAFYFLELRKYSLFFIFLTLTAMTKEHMPLLFITFGVYIWMAHRKKWIAIKSIGAGMIWVYTNFWIILPYFAKRTYVYLHGASIIDVIIDRLADPLQIVLHNIPFFVLLLLPIGLGIFVFFSPIFLLSIFQIGMIIFFINGGIREIIVHHQASIFPFILVSSIYGVLKLKKISESLYRAIPLFLITTAVLSFLIYSPFMITHTKETFNPFTEHVRQGKEMIKEIGPESSVISTNWIIPHLSQRSDVYMLDHFTRNVTFSGPPLRLLEAGPPQFILLDLSGAIKDPMRSAERIKKEDLDMVFNNQDYGVEKTSGTWVLLEYGNPYENVCQIASLLKIVRPVINIYRLDLEKC